MVGRKNWRKSAAHLVALAAVAGLLFATVAPRTDARAGLERLRGGVADSIRSIVGEGESPEARLARGVRISGQSAEAYAKEQDRLLRDKSLVRWGGVDFDPLQGGQRVHEKAPAELVAPRKTVPPALVGTELGNADYYIFQYTGRAPEARRAVEKAGASVVTWIPNSAWLVRADEAQRRQLETAPEARWVGPHLPAYKLDGGMLDVLGAGADTTQLPVDERGLVRVQVDLWEGVPVEPYRDLVKAMPGVEIGIEVLDAERGGFLLLVAPDAVRATTIELASMADVANVVSLPMPFIQNAQSIWYLQSGLDQINTTDYMTSAPLFARGITGRGLAVAVADDGLENDPCQFRYGPAVDEAAWVVGPPSSDANPVPAEGGLLPTDPSIDPPERTRARKVIAYYVQSNAAAYSETAQHGTMVAGAAVADANDALAGAPYIRDLGQSQNVDGYGPGLNGDWSFGQEIRPDLAARVRTSPNDYIADRDGMAPGGQLVMQDIGSGTQLTGLFRADQLLDQAHGTGATSHNTSFGGNPCDNCYSGHAPFADGMLWRRRDMVAFSSAGNAGDQGPRTIGAGFAHGKTVISVGATERGNFTSCDAPPCAPPATTLRGHDIASFSSKGPCTGNRLCPEIVAPGIVVTTGIGWDVTPEDGSGSGDGGCGPATTQAAEGTSFSSPTMAGLALLVQQYFLDGFYPSGAANAADAMRPTNALIRAVLVNSARDLLGARTNADGTGQAHRPNMGQGWGAPRLDDTLYFQNDRQDPNPLYDTQRARLVVLTDTPNGFILDNPMESMALEPGGRRRDEIVNNWYPAITDNDIHEFFIDVVNDDPTDLANELRITLAWADQEGPTGTAPLVNDLDLEVISPGPNGVLDTDADVLEGDDIVYRTNPTTSWNLGYTQPSATAAIQARPLFTNFGDRDPANTVENVFIPPQEVQAGPWRVRVIGYNVPGRGLQTFNARPNFVDGDQPEVFDADGDGTVDTEQTDHITDNRQGYALIVSGNLTTTQGLLSLNQSSFGCEDGRLSLTLNDQNGGAAAEAPCANGPVSAEIRTSTPSASFPSDLEQVDFTGSQPTYRSRNPVTGGTDFEIVIVTDPSAVIHGDGIIQVAPGETIIATYDDRNPCGGTSFVQATVRCQPSVDDSGFLIEDGCDYVRPGDPNSGVRPDEFMDAGELNRYTVFFVNTGAEDLHDAVVSLVPDPANPLSASIQVLNSPQHVGLAPPGRRSDATFLVQMPDVVPPQYQIDFIVEVVSPRDGLLFADTFTQTHIVEADNEVHRYNTRDPNGELWGKNKVERTLDGSQPTAATPPENFFINDPLWFDPDAAAAAGVDCIESRLTWPDADSDGIREVPDRCLPFVVGADPADPTTWNPTDPWDFDDDDEGFVEVPHSDDTVVVGTNTPWLWNYKRAPGGGGCGWEDQIHAALATFLPAGHPDRIAQPWGIWHTGEINPVTPGPINGDPTASQGVPFKDTPGQPDDHTILWDSRPAPGVDNRLGQWCQTYFSQAIGQYYRSILLAPQLHRVHQSNPDYRIEFQELRFASRIDGHTRDGDNLLVADWLVNNQPIEPVTAAGDYSWAQFQAQTHIFSDDVNSDWSVDDNEIIENLAVPDVDFPDLSYEDVYGPAGDSFHVAVGASHLHFDGYRSRGQYGFGLDDVEFVWTESREVADQSDCNALPNAGPPPTVFFDETRYNACEGEMTITVVDDRQTAPRIGVCVTSAAEDYEVAVLERVNGRYQGSIAFSVDPRNDAVGTLLVSAGLIDIGNGADTVRAEYDPNEAADFETKTAEDMCDWRDVEPPPDGNGINDDVAPADGIPDAEDDTVPPQERADTAVVNCTSGRLFYIKHELVQVGAGDGDRFADHGETQRMRVYLVSSLGADLADVTVRISTNDPICIINDTVQMATLPGNESIVPVPAPGPAAMFEFAVPLGYRSLTPTAPRTITFRVDVSGTNTQNLNQFSTAGESFNTFLPLEAVLLADVDERVAAVDYMDTAPGRPVGTFREGFDGGPGSGGFDHPLQLANRPGLMTVMQDTTTDTRFGMDRNGGFCPECDYQQDNECAVPDACEFHFTANGPTGNPTRQPGYPDAVAFVDTTIMGLNQLRPVEWTATDDWAHSGIGAYKWGDPGAAPDEVEQHYSAGQYASLLLPPLRVSNDPTVTPILSFWHIPEIWSPNFTNGLQTPIDGAVVEISASPQGVGDPHNRQRANPLLYHPQSTNTRYPLSSYRRLSPYKGVYDYETDALNACRALFCRYKHPVFANQGSPTISQVGTDPRNGSVGPGTWEKVEIDLSDYRGMEVVIAFSAEVLQDLDIQAGSQGWLVDEIEVTGLSNTVAIQAQARMATVEPCGLVADFSAPSPACFGDDVQFFDRHTGTGAFDMATGQPFPIDFEWTIPGMPTFRGPAGAVVTPPVPGVFGTYDNPRINLRTAAGVSSPGPVNVTLTLHQNGATYTVTKTIIYKDAPVPVINVGADAHAGGATRFDGEVGRFNPSLDPDRTLTWTWDFGDGTPVAASGPSVTHEFAAPGTYDVTLTVTDEDGCTGTVVRQVVVTAAPDFNAPLVTFVTECPGGVATADGNADIGEYVTVNISFFNNSSTLASDAVAYLSSTDPLVEITTGAADYGSVPGMMRSGDRPFTFMRRDDGSTTSCLVIPFQLTVVSNGGTVMRVLDVPYTMGQAMDLSHAAPAQGPLSTCLLNASGSSGTIEFPITGTPSGCLNGLEMRLRLSASPGGLMDTVAVYIDTPAGDRIQLMNSNDGPNTRTHEICFAFGVTNASPIVPDTSGLVDDQCDTLEPAVEATLISQLVGSPMSGAVPWIVGVQVTRRGDCSITYTANLDVFDLEGSNSGDLDIVPNVECTNCVGGAAPLFQPARVECNSGSTLVWSPAVDLSSCDGVSDVTYELYASTVAGQLGMRVDNVPARSSGCADPICADLMCASPRSPVATWWRVCDTLSVHWTVVAVDGSGQRRPNISAPTDSTIVNGVNYQTALTSCEEAISAGVHAIVKGGTPSAPTMTLWTIAPPDSSLSGIYPPAGATSYRLLRGTIPTVAGSFSATRTMGTRITSSRDEAYDHVGVVCSFSTASRDLTIDLSEPGSFYYLVPGINTGGCWGMGYRGTPNPAGGGLEYVEPIPGNGWMQPVTCTPTCMSP